MSPKIIKIYVSLLSILFIFNILQPVSATVNSEAETEEYLVVYKQPATSAVLQSRTTGIKQKSSLNKQNTTVLMKLTPSQAANFQQDSTVAWVEPNGKVSIQSETNPDRINQEHLAWGNLAIGSQFQSTQDPRGEQIKVAVLDTGIAQHPALIVKGGVSFVPGNTSFEDDHGHGTHVAGIIAAQESEHMTGVAPNVDLYAVKVLDAQGDGTHAQLIQAIEWSIEQHMNIISMSFAGSQYSEAVKQAIERAQAAGILIVASAGNWGEGEDTIMYPAKYDGVVSVGASTAANKRANLSSTGTRLDLVAPGVSIYSTNKQGGYELQSGTSMSAAFVTGAAAVVWSQNVQKTGDEVKQSLVQHATSLGASREFGYGLVNLAKSLGLIDDPLPPYQADFIDVSTPVLTESKSDYSVSATVRGDIVSVTATAPALTSGTAWTKVYLGVNGPLPDDKTRVYTISKTGSFAKETKVTFNFRADRSWLLGVYNVIITFEASGNASKSFTFKETITPESPENIRLTPSRYKASVAWGEVKGVADYEVIVDGSVKSRTSNKSAEITGLNPNKSYQVQVRAVDPSNAGKHATSSTYTLTTLNPLPVPGNLSASNIKDTSMTISWNGVTGASGYIIYRTGEKVGEVSSPATSIQLTGLSPAVEYRISARTIDPENTTATGELSSYLFVTTANAPAPANFVATLVTTETITMKWDAVPGAKTYTFTISADGKLIETKAITAPLTTYTYSGLKPGKLYTLRVSANNSNVAEMIVSTDGLGSLPSTLKIVMDGKTYTATPY
ncbi:S8 family serine peptidase [Paenibacillus sp. GCM10012307]|uniref:S8 family serine peptidase n=1 Tax=Paenibacillus roseus TaxID=2798579 RepID=A0A934J964_9BACL|nr:S8 family serine peptidase [Paenibacillus roseus]MBJ6362737.1 S8 family serine peptidase [Paenibacillus roseus]